MPSETCNRVRVERYFLEEASAEEKRETGLHIDGCPRCKEHLDFLSREQKAYLAVRPFTSYAAKHLEKKAPSFGLLPGPRWLPALAGGLACLALVTVIRFQSKDQGGPGAVAVAPTTAAPGEEGVTYKGGEALEFAFRRDGKLAPGSLDQGYRSGDELQFSYSSGAFATVSLLSVDAKGTVSLYRKEGAASASLPAVAGKVEPFPFSVTLDDAQGGELFVLVLSAAPVEDKALEDWLSNAWKEAHGDLARTEASLASPVEGGKLKTLLLKKVST
jgi:hypothetical protein